MGSTFLLPPPRKICIVICLLATLHKNFQMDLHEIFREGWQWLNFGGDPDPIRIATLVRCALMEV